MILLLSVIISQSDELKDRQSPSSASSSPEHAMIPVMVDLANILRVATEDIYLDVSKRSLRDKSQISFKLDAALDVWKEKLPQFLNLDSFALDNDEWAFKQKLVLQFRAYPNLRLMISVQQC